MDVQLTIVVVLVLLSAAFVARSLWKSLLPGDKPGCGSGCGKCATTPRESERRGMIALDQVRLPKS